jgi:cobalt-zinc-cadmium efflux system outer membrane protein
VEEHFRAGSIAKSELFQAQIEKKGLLSQLKQRTLAKVKAKNELFLFANLERESDPFTKHVFMQSSTRLTSPLLHLSKKQEEVAHAQLAVASHTLENIELFSEMEVEPDQDIFRVGVSIPLSIFHDKSEEKQLGKIAIHNQKLTIASQERALGLELSQLQEEIEVQKGLLANQECLLETDIAIEKRIIKINYLQGAYNDQ